MTEQARNPYVIDTLNERQVRVRIGPEGYDSQWWYTYVPLQQLRSVAEDVPPGRESTVLLLHLPESVAEYYRQQGRRQLQNELRILLNAARS